jgi:hypothetical protein
MSNKIFNPKKTQVKNKKALKIFKNNRKTNPTNSRFQITKIYNLNTIQQIKNLVKIQRVNLAIQKTKIAMKTRMYKMLKISRVNLRKVSKKAASNHLPRRLKI